VDSITYVLAGKLSQERGWGVKDDTFFCLKTMGQMEEPNWFHIGDRDLALHIFRSKLLAEGKTLSEATDEIATRLDIKARILPMSNSRIETRVLTPAGELSFEEYFVRRRYQDPVESVRFAGASDSEPAPGVIDAIRSAEIVVLAPSNPVTSIGPILAVPGICEALRETRARVVAVSPIVGGAAVTGPAGALLASQGFAVSIAGVADFYRDFLDVLVVDSQDAPGADELRKNQRLGRTGLQVHCASTIMRKNNNGDRIALAKSVMAACKELPKTRSAVESA
jgi:LPPG:FO 2-phospho-L-lactate transferase